MQDYIITTILKIISKIILKLVRHKKLVVVYKLIQSISTGYYLINADNLFLILPTRRTKINLYNLSINNLSAYILPACLTYELLAFK